MSAVRTYDAFGNIVSNHAAWQGPFGYAGGFGYQEDATGLRLLGHRYYDPSIGCFLTRDPIKDGRNWYSYGGGHGAPTGLADPNGLAPILLVFAVVGIAIVVGVLVYGLAQGIGSANEAGGSKRRRLADYAEDPQQAELDNGASISSTTHEGTTDFRQGIADAAKSTGDAAENVIGIGEQIVFPPKTIADVGQLVVEEGGKLIIGKLQP